MAQSIRLADLPGVQEFLDAVAVLLDTVNAADVPPPVTAAADRVRAEALGLGNGPVAYVEDETAPGRAENEIRLRSAMSEAMEIPGRRVVVDWVRE